MQLDTVILTRHSCTYSILTDIIISARTHKKQLPAAKLVWISSPRLYNYKLDTVILTNTRLAAQLHIIMYTDWRLNLSTQLSKLNQGKGSLEQWIAKKPAEALLSYYREQEKRDTT